MPPIAKALAAIQDAETHLVALSQKSASEGRWDEAQSFLNAAQTLDRVKTQLSHGRGGCEIPLTAHRPRAIIATDNLIEP